MTGLFTNPRHRPTGDPREHVCRTCGVLACFGDGNVWWCRSHVPPSFFDLARGGPK